ncbi:unnamed protein product [Linum tenue]|uniref:Trichome birefringence-like N-terminal domain-containing protein n=1 Tax=Linum tenue TaxID=586396 RepID=A0AAV0LDB8_9ROSI|nr:unnamed protein product [Linum tenue]
MDTKKVGLPDQLLLSPTRKLLSGFALWIASAFFIILSVLLLSSSLKGRAVFQGFNHVSVNSSSLVSSWPFSFPASYFPGKDNATASAFGVVLGKVHLGNLSDESGSGDPKGGFVVVGEEDPGSVRQNTQVAQGENLTDSTGVGSNIHGLLTNGSLPVGEPIAESESREISVKSNMTDHAGRRNTTSKEADWSNGRAVEQGQDEKRSTEASYQNCDIFDGRWERDDSKPFYPAGSCPHIDKDFDCHFNGRPDSGYVKWRWQPNGCDIPRESSFSGANGTFETLRLDLMDKTTSMYHDADILVFNTGHWWTHEKTSKGEDYYQEGSHLHRRLKVLEAYKRALKTWARWVDRSTDRSRTHVFFRGYSVTHFRGGQWNSGGQCHKETEPIFNSTHLAKYPTKMKVLQNVLNEMKTPVTYLNISRLTDHRKDAHPSIYRMKYKTAEELIAAERAQDCSHWCLPGVPDTWNELLYVSLLKSGFGSWKT